MQAPKKHTNRLINETSPYLLQHAHNPVDWYPWGEEAFERARAEDKPLLVSIGYSACHWCHVMEHESFEDEAVAAIMNEHFINIKVDMEERPDVDQIYMNFVQLTTGRGGWPMNVFITPEKLPFFGGTYSPPTPRHGMVSWQQILLSIGDAWKTKRDELMGSAHEILGTLRRVGIAEFEAGNVSEELPESAFKSFVRSFDAKNGGWGGAPKFPAAMSMEFLLRYWKRTGNENALAMVRHTAEKMASGGIYDQLGGGFHRYSVDAVWLVPHFEKMLYDNAQLIRIYLYLYQIARSGENAGVNERAGDRDDTPHPSGSVSNRGDAEFFKQVAVETLEYVRREMTGPDGGFYSTQDADSEGEEGKFFVWTLDEVVAILGEADARVFCLYYDISEEGNFEGSNILNVKNAPEEVAEALGMSASEVGSVVARAREVLLAAREKRVKPNRDEKVLTAWNGLMLAAFAEAAAVLRNGEYLETAKRNADFLLANLTVRAEDAGGSPVLQSVLRTWKDGKAKLNGYIEDYANLADGLIELYQASGEERYLTEARRLADTMITEFWDEENGGFYFTSNDHEELIVRNKDLYDNATPSGNSAGADVLLKLAKFYGDEKYERFGTAILRLAASQIRQHPQGFGRALSAVEFLLADVKEVAIVGDGGSDLESEVWADYRPFKVVALSQGADSDLPLLDGRSKTDGPPMAYVCKGFVCSRPVTEVADLRDSL